MVNNANAKSTQLNDNESVEHYTGKCQAHAEGWAPVSDQLWKWDHETIIDHKAEADKMWEMIKNIPKIDIGLDPETKKEEARKLKVEIKKNGTKSKEAELSGVKVDPVSYKQITKSCYLCHNTG